MEKKKSINFIFAIIAIILGVTLYKQFDFETLRFEHNGMAVIYGIVFLFSIFIIVKDYRQKPQQ